MRGVLLFLLVAFVAASTGDELADCDDGTENVIRVYSTSGTETRVMLSNVTMTTYDANMRPACNATGGDVTFPGSAHFTAGQLTIQSAVDQYAVKVLLSMRKSDADFSWVCINGEVQDDLVDPIFCKFDLCSNNVIFAFGLCEALSTPQTLNFNDNSIFFFFNPVPFESRNLMTGMWKVQAQGMLGDELLFDWTFLGAANDPLIHITKTMVQ